MCESFSGMTQEYSYVQLQEWKLGTLNKDDDDNDDPGELQMKVITHTRQFKWSQTMSTINKKI